MSHEDAPLAPLPDAAQVERAAALFRALGDPGRLSVLLLLRGGEACVSAVADALGGPLPTISQRLKVLEREGLVRRRREGRHIHYALVDEHLRDIIENGLVHAGEVPAAGPSGR